ncbi:MAG: GNAT family N-acetyltransferase [Chloroflexi bacterium AL-W]|nr:GNAT family N-acetyltransferase [Chloroflexi bacterium AL-N1]NOK70115.1 GNAT family N-acetyltransferase [Chloroflexi bacterium AL-N10]NOK77873.1 GNAT family N-acetyltransferase [Chloroflexi bacterium AL-N5]NOK84882.1 GNAT family N-acetyltransferase [Chloroflexi bacterium AL-W]NOK91861.1 GNAT family N-acetyltransferase [Chloroflexi bacterium AL-N15]
MLRTAYVEAVATDLDYQQRGVATRVMETLQEHIYDFDMGALLPASTSLYTRLGWGYWRGPLLIRCKDGILPTPDKQIMIWHLPHTTMLDLSAPLSAEWREGE